jgi:MFS family permease
MANRFSLPAILVVSCVAIGAAYVPAMWAGSVVLLALCLIMAGVFRGGLSTSSNAMVGMAAVAGQQGLAYGLSQSANSLGGAFGPLIGGALGRMVGLPPVFLVSGIVYLAVGIVAARLLLRRRLSRAAV